MSYIPIVPTAHAQEPSRPTRELADLLGRVVQEYEKAHPTITGPEVRQALQLARRASTKSGGPGTVAFRAFGAGLLVLLGTVFLFLRADGGLDTARVPVIAGIVGVGLVVGLVAILRRLR
jgi:hypothetical protein